MFKKCFILFFLFLFVSLTSETYAGKNTKPVQMFGKVEHDDSVDIDRIHSNLHRFSQLAKEASKHKSSNNIAVGAVTVVYESPNSKSKVARTFYLEKSHPNAERALVAFESTPEQHDGEHIPLGSTGLGMVDGHSSVVFQDNGLKSLPFEDLSTYFRKYYNWHESNPDHPMVRMAPPLSTLIGHSRQLRVVAQSLKEELSPLQESHKMAQRILSHRITKSDDSDSDSMEDLVADFDELETDSNLDPDISTIARDYAFDIDNSSEKLMDQLKLLLSRQDNIDKLIAEETALRKKVRNAATAIYRACWHSEQRLVYFLLASLDTEIASSNLSSTSTSSLDSRKQEGANSSNTFNWDNVEKVGGDWRPIAIYFHVHSFREFCSMCEFTLARLFPEAFAEFSEFRGVKIKVLGSYSDNGELKKVDFINQ